MVSVQGLTLRLRPRPGQADIFITGDAALLRLAVVGTLKIVSPRRFWDVLRAGNE